MFNFQEYKNYSLIYIIVLKMFHSGMHKVQMCLLLNTELISMRLPLITVLSMWSSGSYQVLVGVVLYKLCCHGSLSISFCGRLALWT